MSLSKSVRGRPRGIWGLIRREENERPHPLAVGVERDATAFTYKVGASS